MRARLGSIDGRRLTGSLARITVAAACTGVAASLAAVGLGNAVGTATHGSQLIQVVGGVVAGLGIFLVASRVLQIDEVTAVVQLVRRRNR
jgi:putative peptidoglycan lipid II flippase